MSAFRRVAGTAISATLILAVAALYSPAVRADTIRMRADRWCPYTCDPTSDKPGYMIEIAREALEPFGHKIDYAVMPWTRTVKDVTEGHVDAAVGAGSEEVIGGVIEAEPMGTVTDVLVTLSARKFSYDGAQSLEPLKIGVIASYTFDDGGEIDKYIQQHLGLRDDRVQAIAGENVAEYNFHKLATGRIDGLIDSAYVIDHIVMNMADPPQIDRFVIDKPTDIYIAFSPKNPKSPAYAKQLNEGIAKLRASGRLQEILSRYGIPIWD